LVLGTRNCFDLDIDVSVESSSYFELNALRCAYHDAVNIFRYNRSFTVALFKYMLSKLIVLASEGFFQGANSEFF